MNLDDTIGSMQIELTQGKKAIIDAEDYTRVSKTSWCYDKSNGYPVSRIKGKRVRLHRFILNNPEARYVDHVNRDKLDNRKINLRICDSSQNVRNRGLNKNNTSGFKGVTKVRDKWRAQLSIGYKFYDLGTFDSPKEAAKAYNEKVIEVHGQYAFLNKI